MRMYEGTDERAPEAREALAEAALECAADLEAELRDRYGMNEGDPHPAMVSRFLRDIEVVIRVRRLAALLSERPDAPNWRQAAVDAFPGIRGLNEDEAKLQRRLVNALATFEPDAPGGEREPVGDYNCIGCRRCLEGVTDADGWPVTSRRMIVCAICGNKRCPHATDHRLACTGSNEPGQPGSVFGPAPLEAP